MMIAKLPTAWSRLGCAIMLESRRTSSAMLGSIEDMLEVFLGIESMGREQTAREVHALQRTESPYTVYL